MTKFDESALSRSSPWRPGQKSRNLLCFRRLRGAGRAIGLGGCGRPRAAERGVWAREPGRTALRDVTVRLRAGTIAGVIITPLEAYT